jgi:hypothetical protein
VARYDFGATLADYVVRPTDGLWGVAPGAALTFWSAADGGTQYTDLLDAGGTPVSSIAADSDGFIPAFKGPDGVTGMWVDAGGTSRAWMPARNASGGSGGGGYTSVSRIVASATAPADVRAAATYVCDGVADQVQIQQAIDDARNNGGGEIQLTVGTYNLSAPLSIEGTDDVDVEIGIILRGQGARATMLNAGSGLTSAIHLTKVVRVYLSDFGLTIGGATHGITSATNGGASSGHRSFWNSEFRNIQINGPWDGTHTGWALRLGSPFRSVFENLEIGGVRNGVLWYSEHADFNPGDCTWTRSFVELVGDGGTAYQIDSPAGMGTMNQTNWSMAEAYANGAGCKGIVVNGSHNRFIGSNLEQFATLVQVTAGEGNTVDCNYITCLDGAAGNKAFVAGTGAYNNRFSANTLNIHGGDTVKALEDANSNSSAPNVFERIRMEVNSGSNVTYSTVSSTVLRDITAVLDGGTVQAGLLRYPISDYSDPTFRPSDHNLIAWTQDPATLRTGGDTTTSGTVYLAKVKITSRNTLVSNIIVGILGSPAGLTSGNVAGLYDSSGARLAVTADQTTAWSTVGTKVMALTAPVTLQPGYYYVALLSNGTTPPQFATGGGGSSATNAGLTAATARFLTGPTGQTALPASITLSSGTPVIGARWAALS